MRQADKLRANATYGSCQCTDNHDPKLNHDECGCECKRCTTCRCADCRYDRSAVEPWELSRSGLLCVAVILLSGCASPATRVLTSVNGYHYWINRHAERCPSETESICKETSVLTRWHTALGEADAALQRGGKLPLQLDALKRVEKESKQWRP